MVQLFFIIVFPQIPTLAKLIQYVLSDLMTNGKILLKIIPNNQMNANKKSAHAHASYFIIRKITFLVSFQFNAYIVCLRNINVFDQTVFIGYK